MAERSHLFKSRAAHTSVRAVWKNWLPADAVVMARKAALDLMEPPAEPLPATRSTLSKVSLVIVTDRLDSQAKPLLDRMIQAMALSPEKVVILEIESESDFRSQLASFQQKSLSECLVTLGASVTRALFGPEFSYDSQKGQWQSIEGFPGLQDVRIMPTLDLQTLLKNPAAKKEAWADLQKVMKALAG